MDQLVQRFQMSETRPEEVIAADWVSIIGDRNARHAHPLRLDRHQRLYVAVNNPVVKQEMQFHKKIILGRLNQLPGCEGIQQLVFRSG